MTSLSPLLVAAGDPVLTLPVAEDATIATFLGQSQGSTLTLDTSFNGAFKLVGNVLKAGAAMNRPGLYNVHVTETLAGAVGSPMGSGLNVRVNVVLSALSLSATSIYPSASPGALVGNITGKTPGSTLEVFPNDGRVVLAGSDVDGWRLVVGLSAISVGTIPISLRETFPGNFQVGRDTPVTLSVAYETRRLIMMGGRAAGQGLAAGENMSVDRVFTTCFTRTFGEALKYVQVVFQGGIINNSSVNGVPVGETGVGNIIIRAAMEKITSSGPTVVPITFSGSQSGTLLNKGELISDPIYYEQLGGAAGSSFPLNTFFGIRIEQRGAALGAALIGGHRASSTITTPSRSEQNVFFGGAPAVDSLYATGPLDTTGAVTVSGGTGLCFAGLIGEYAAGVTPKPAVMWMADSIQSRYTTLPAFNAIAGTGGVAIEQALRSLGLPWHNSGLASSRMSDYLGSGGNESQKRMMRFASALVLPWGTNDLAQGASAADVWIIEQQIYADARARLVKDIVAVPIIPRGSTNDNLSTPQNQSPASGWEDGGKRDQLNVLRSQTGAAGKPTIYIGPYTAAIEDASDHTKALTNGTPNYSYIAADNPSFIHPSSTIQNGGMKTSFVNVLSTLTA